MSDKLFVRERRLRKTFLEQQETENSQPRQQVLIPKVYQQ